MAATRATATGHGRGGYPQSRPSTRLGHGAAQGRADTWRTLTTCYVKADGSGFVEVRRDGELLHHFDFGAEG